MVWKQDSFKLDVKRTTVLAIKHLLELQLKDLKPLSVSVTNAFSAQRRCVHATVVCEASTFKTTNPNRLTKSSIKTIIKDIQDRLSVQVSQFYITTLLSTGPSAQLEIHFNLTRISPQAPQLIKSVSAKPVSLRENTTPKVSFSISTVTKEKILITNLTEQSLDEVKPVHLFENDRNVTRKFTGRSNLCRRILKIIKDHLSTGAPHCRTLLHRTVKQSSNHGIKPSEPLKSYNAVAPPPTLPTSEYSYNLNASRLSSPPVFKAVRNVLSLAVQDSGSTQVTKDGIVTVSPEAALSRYRIRSFSYAESLNMIINAGLPCNSSLSTIYSRFCIERGLCSDVLSDLDNNYNTLVEYGAIQYDLD